MLEKINQIEPIISEDDIQNITDYLQSGSWITEHKVTKKLENQISDYVNKSYAVAVPNGTIAIYLALICSGISEGKKVAVPNITMIATINAIIWCGAKPVIVDVDESLCMSLESLERVEGLDAVIYVPLNGRSGNADKVSKYCKANGITLIEDSAHALGSSYTNQKCGSLGDISIFSFTPHKIITMGQGGMVLLDDKSIYEKLIDLKTFNREIDKVDIHKGFGLNFKITDLQASLGISQFEKLQTFIDLKNNVFDGYSKRLNKNLLGKFSQNEVPWFIDFYCESEEQKIKLYNFLKDKNIETRFAYPALSSQKYLDNVEKVDLTYSENMASKILWLPSSCNLSDDDIDFISSQINIFYKNETYL